MTLEWTELENYVGGRGTAGGKMKAVDSEPYVSGVWRYPNAGATNESGFSGLPGGSLSSYGIFEFVNNAGYWWSSTEQMSTFGFIEPIVRELWSNSCSIYREQSSPIALSVRCVKD